jgi:hypothetical protein
MCGGNAQVKLEAAQGKPRNLLAQDFDYIHVQVATSRVPESVNPKPVPIDLVHPIYSAANGFEICLIVKVGRGNCPTRAVRRGHSWSLAGVGWNRMTARAPSSPL